LVPGDDDLRNRWKTDQRSLNMHNLPVHRV